METYAPLIDVAEPDGRCRRVSPTASSRSDGPLSDHRAGGQPAQRELVFMPLSCRCRGPARLATLRGVNARTIGKQPTLASSLIELGAEFRRPRRTDGEGDLSVELTL